MNDRELLELAAKAAGIDGWFVEDDDWYGTGIVYTDPEDCNHTWNPLEDDGDALRLAVKLKINLEHMEHLNRMPFGINAWPVGRGDCGASEDDAYLDDPYAATRLAIVRSAAEIGKEMK